MNTETQEPLPTMEDEFEVPPEIQNTAEKYRDALTAKGKATAKFNSAKDQLIGAMREHGYGQVRVQVKDGYKIIELNQEDKLKMRKPKSSKDDDDSDDD